ncbi:class I SAM-dependent methyltransferase [Blastococcus sp. CCUG 61487]|uniref:class I SAM-dependent methyltransferase n=1 Tax=Blastococcus sp. CCUG 61487 TaxID=1840703 RepID=UPI0010BFFB21|nr:class I SAM-dependent methyltransferase [Blastococcus sp. CCUG 61487]TKJ20643.1 methyltransferase type 11 [Blastococcus sp. CCUG 61487]
MSPRGRQATVHHPLFARCYARLATAMEAQGAADLRDELLQDTTGRVLEVGAGSGANFAHYPRGVDQVVAVEPEAYLRELAEQAAARAPVPVTVVDGLAEQLPVADGSVDTAVLSLVLCSVPDQAAALAEVHRVLRPGGRLHFWEHVRSERPRHARIQGVLDATVWPRLGGGCHAARDTASAIEAAGFGVERMRRFPFPERGLTPTRPQILGVAIRP